MKKKSSTNMVEVVLGAGIIALSLLTPIPDDFVGVPLGLGMIAHGFGALK
jgi:hypothetical protein